jgi:hypothetical protein
VNQPIVEELLLGSRLRLATGFDEVSSMHASIADEDAFVKMAVFVADPAYEPVAVPVVLVPISPEPAGPETVVPLLRTVFVGFAGLPQTILLLKTAVEEALVKLLHDPTIFGLPVPLIFRSLVVVLAVV